MSGITQGERIASLEAQVANMRAEQLANAISVDRKHAEVAGKLDELIALRNKGAGVFWLASILFGASVFGAAAFIISLFKT